MQASPGNGDLKLEKSAKGRKETDGSEAVIKTRPLKEQFANLKSLKLKSKAAGDKYNAAAKAVAEQSGLLSSVVNKLVSAAVGNNFEKKKQEVEQASIVFDEVGEGAPASD